MAFLGDLYPWIKTLHLAAVISWMAALFYLPRLLVHHVERSAPGSGSEMDETFHDAGDLGCDHCAPVLIDSHALKA